MVGRAPELRITRAVASARDGNPPWGELATELGTTEAAVMARWAEIREGDIGWFGDVVLELMVQNGGSAPDHGKVPLPRKIVEDFVARNTPTEDQTWTEEMNEKLDLLVGNASTVSWADVAKPLEVTPFDACAQWCARNRMLVD